MILQWPMAYPGLVTHTMAGLCALMKTSAASTSGKLQYSAKLHPPQTTCPARTQHPVLHFIEAVLFDLAVANGMPRAGHSHNGKTLCTVVAEQRLHI